MPWRPYPVAAARGVQLQRPSELEAEADIGAGVGVRAAGTPEALARCQRATSSGPHQCPKQLTTLKMPEQKKVQKVGIEPTITWVLTKGPNH